MSRVRIGLASWGLASWGLAALAASGLAAPAASAQDMLTTLGLNASAPAPDAVSPAPKAQPVSAPAQPPPAAVIPASTAPSSTASAPPTPLTPASPASPAGPKLTQAQLDQLLAPIALYPDPLLAQVLMASTYPLEVVEAARWAAIPANRALTGAALIDAAKAQRWDPSIVALVPFPHLLALMSDKIQWTQQLGGAFVAQQSDVMAAVQSLRREALAAGNLKATPQCGCTIKTSGGTIAILPANPQMVCVPVYNPVVAYGPWPVPAYPPMVLPVPVGFVYPPGIAIGFFPPIEVAVFGPFWGWGWFDWHLGHIVVDGPRYAMIDPRHGAFAGGVWRHDFVRDPARFGRSVAADPRAAHFGAARAAGAAAVRHAATGTVHHGAGFHAARASTAHAAFHGRAVAGRSFHTAHYAGHAVHFRGGHATHFAARGGVHGGGGGGEHHR